MLGEPDRLQKTPVGAFPRQGAGGSNGAGLVADEGEGTEREGGGLVRSLARRFMGR